MSILFLFQIFSVFFPSWIVRHRKASVGYHLFNVQEHDKQFSVLFKDIHIVKKVFKRVRNDKLQM